MSCANLCGEGAGGADVLEGGVVVVGGVVTTGALPHRPKGVIVIDVLKTNTPSNYMSIVQELFYYSFRKSANFFCLNRNLLQNFD